MIMTVSIHRYLKIVLAIVTLGLALYIFLSVYYKRPEFAFITFSSNNRFRGVIVTLIRSTNQSILLVINMIHSVNQFYPTSDGYVYPFLIFHDQNFTSSMRQQILSCTLKSNKKIQISFALVDFQTLIQPSKESPVEKKIGYRLMCRFWTYDVFYHPAIVQGRYDYLMRMDDDSYFSSEVKKDLFLYMDSQKLDYIYRSTYWESRAPMEPILKRFLNETTIDNGCIYNNFCMIRLKWFYESKRVQSFVRELIKDNLMLREYIGDGCAHAAMLKVDNQVKVEHMTDIPYGHNYHIMPSGESRYRFQPMDGLYEEINKSCEQLTVLRDRAGILTRINVSKERVSLK
jgi:hypothetical protein